VAITPSVMKGWISRDSDSRPVSNRETYSNPESKRRGGMDEWGRSRNASWKKHAARRTGFVGRVQVCYGAISSLRKERMKMETHPWFTT